MADKGILEFVQSSKNIIDADSDGGNEMNNAVSVLMPSVMKNIIKKVRFGECDELLHHLAAKCDEVALSLRVTVTVRIVFPVRRELTKETGFSERTLDAEVDDPGLKKERRERWPSRDAPPVVHERDALVTLNTIVQYKPWDPHIVCQKCVVCLRLWSSGKRDAVMFETPMIWREPQNHHDDCYFYVVKINGINPGNRNNWSYPNLSSAQQPQLKSLEVQPSTSKSSNDPNPCDPERNTSSENSDSDYKFSQEPQPFNQKELSDLVRDLNLPKEASEIHS
ncbi:uncharacterized protein TNCV_4341131 [Trichonephila clavipes]|nr:uncharacterized protein TNCV_4341131 [Trichonephila clavipes]